MMKMMIKITAVERLLISLLLFSLPTKIYRGNKFLAKHLALGVYYIIIIVAYMFFEVVVINYRPTLIDGYLEASYPSSTTMLVMCVMPTAAMQLNMRIKNTFVRRLFIIVIMAFTMFMVICRLLSGVHWITDIIGGVLFSAGSAMLYYSISNIVAKNTTKSKHSA